MGKEPKNFMPVRQFERYAHDADGNMFKLTMQVDKKGVEVELERVDLHQKLLWTGITADLGIRKFKQSLSPRMKKRDRKFLIDGYKTNVWQQKLMREHLANTARA